MGLKKTWFPKQPPETASGQEDREKAHWLQASTLEVPRTRTTDLSPWTLPQPWCNQSHVEENRCNSLCQRVRHGNFSSVLPWAGPSFSNSVCPQYWSICSPHGPVLSPLVAMHKGWELLPKAGHLCVLCVLLWGKAAGQHGIPALGRVIGLGCPLTLSRAWRNTQRKKRELWVCCGTWAQA